VEVSGQRGGPCTGCESLEFSCASLTFPDMWSGSPRFWSGSGFGLVLTRPALAGSMSYTCLGAAIMNIDAALEERGRG